MKISGLFTGLPAKNKTLILLSVAYTSVTGWIAYSYHREEKNAEKQAFVEFFRESGHYKHPWVKNPAPVPEHVKKTDYTKLVELPKNSIRS
jgi:hypothetical protein